MYKTSKMFEVISHAAQDAIVMIDTSGKVIYWNPAAERIFGYSEEEALNKDVHLLLAPEKYINDYKEGFANFIMTGEGPAIGKTLEFGAIRKDNVEIVVELSVSAINLNDKWHALAIVRDITERKETEEKIKEYQEQLQAIYDGIVDGLVILDLSTGKFVSVNPSFCEMFGYSKEELLNMGIKDLHPEEHLDRVLNEFNEKLEGKKTMSIDTPCLRKDGSIFYVDIVDSQIHFNNQSCVIGFFRDTTERLKSRKMRENFIATLSHDLRVPLLAENHALRYLIKGSYGDLTEKQINAANNMYNSNRDLLNLVRTLLDAYRYESMELEIITEEVNLFNLVKECVSELYPLLESGNKSIVNLLSEDMPSVCVDKKEIKRVLINLISNAIEHTADNSSIKVYSEILNEYLLMAIEDNGSGIPEEELDKIFDMYYTSSKKFRKVGTGLGLYLSRKIIDAHKGKLWVESELHKGSTFFFTLPLV